MRRDEVWAQQSIEHALGVSVAQLDDGGDCREKVDALSVADIVGTAVGTAGLGGAVASDTRTALANRANFAELAQPAQAFSNAGLGVGGILPRPTQLPQRRPVVLTC